MTKTSPAPRASLAEHERFAQLTPKGPTGMEKSLRLATIAARGAGMLDEASRGVIPPIQPATTFLRETNNPASQGRVYARTHNPTFEAPEAVLRALEGGAAAMVLASGMAAATSILFALRPGDRVVAPAIMYSGLKNWLVGPARDWGLEVAFADFSDTDRTHEAIRAAPTRLVWAETPANPVWTVTDLAAISEIAHAAGAHFVVDNTVSTPLLTRPIDFGADLVVHSATKYLNGHSDVIAGAVVTARADELWERVCANRGSIGGVLGPFEAWLLLRGMRTLAIRVERSCASAQIIAEHLARHPKVSRVLYPGLPSHPGHAIARRQMTGGFSGMLSFEVLGGAAEAIAVADAVEIWRQATSLGGVESLIEHRAPVEGEGTAAAVTMLRCSVGLEDPADLIADLDQALDRAVK